MEEEERYWNVSLPVPDDFVYTPLVKGTSDEKEGGT